MDTIRAKKNWNSYGTTVGLAICELSSIISALKKASTTELNPNFIELSPCGVIHTGHKYGNNDAVCTENMASTLERQVIVERDEIYLNPGKFNEQNYAEIVNKLFSEMVDDYPNIPMPRPTRTHTYDFGYTFMGVWLLDGECKATAGNADKSFMVLHCLYQLVTQDMALYKLTTSNRFYF